MHGQWEGRDAGEGEEWVKGMEENKVSSDHHVHWYTIF